MLVSILYKSFKKTKSSKSKGIKPMNTSMKELKNEEEEMNLDY